MNKHEEKWRDLVDSLAECLLQPARIVSTKEPPIGGDQNVDPDVDPDNVASTTDRIHLKELMEEFLSALDTVAESLAKKHFHKLEKLTVAEGENIAEWSQKLKSLIWIRFGKTARKMSDGDVPKRSFKAYLYGIGKNVVADLYEKQAKMVRRQTRIADGGGRTHVQIDSDRLTVMVTEFALKDYLQTQFKPLASQVIWLCELAHRLVYGTTQTGGCPDLVKFSLNNKELLAAIKAHVVSSYLEARTQGTADALYRHCLRVQYQLELRRHLIAKISNQRSLPPDAKVYMREGTFDDDSAIYRGAQRADTEMFRHLVERNRRMRKAIEEKRIPWLDVMDEFIVFHGPNPIDLMDFSAQPLESVPGIDHKPVDKPWVVEMMRTWDLMARDCVFWLQAPPKP